MISKAAAVLLALFALQATSAQADWISAGPIWNTMDAQRKCPGVCGREGWDGGWKTVDPGRDSVCSCRRHGGAGWERPPHRPGRAAPVEAGPIWNNADAQAKCPRVCGGGDRWDGNWRTVAPGRSTCDCRGR